MTTKRVMILATLDGPLVALATFRLDGDRVVAEYHDEEYRADLEDGGVGVVVAGVFRELRPEDGRIFFESLDRAYSHSTLMRVVSDEPSA